VKGKGGPRRQSGGPGGAHGLYIRKVPATPPDGYGGHHVTRRTARDCTVCACLFVCPGAIISVPDALGEDVEDSGLSGVLEWMISVRTDGWMDGWMDGLCEGLVAWGKTLRTRAFRVWNG
jgi:hypothetical protein